MYKYELRTKTRELRDVTASVKDALEKSGVQQGLCHVYCPHTTAGITVNENARSDVDVDLLLALDKAFPDRAEFRHFEGNSAAHVKASVMGCCVTVPVDGGVLQLGTWQGVFFCEFDGPRNRTFCVTVMGE